MRSLTLLSLSALAAVLSSGCAQSYAQSASPAQDPGRMVELTVYASDFAMVRETRRVELLKGRGRIGLQGVSKQMDQNSVMFDWPSRKDANVVSSTYDLGMGSSGHLLERFLGKEIELVYRGADGKEGERVRGALEVADPGNVVVKSEGKYIINPNATIEAPADMGIVTLPQLSAEVESKTAGSTDLTMAYMTGGLAWSADYTVTLAPDKDELGLECWATVTNKTGTDFPDAKISFVAGAPNRLLRMPEPLAATPASVGSIANRAKVDSPMNDGFQAPQAMGELYAYPYKSTATIRQDEMNRVRMMGSDQVAAKRVYSIALPSISRDYAEFNDNPDQRITATMGIRFANAEASGLGLPLPAGAVRVYEPDATGSPRYIGAASLGDTPKGAHVSLELTNVFDVYARARQVSSQRVDRKHTRRNLEVMLNNEKVKPVEVRLVENFGGSWRMETETSKSGRLNASTNQWKVTVPAEGKTTLRYSVVLGG